MGGCRGRLSYSAGGVMYIQSQKQHKGNRMSCSSSWWSWAMIQLKQVLRTQKPSELRWKQSNSKGHLKPAAGLCWRWLENNQVQQHRCLDPLPWAQQWSSWHNTAMLSGSSFSVGLRVWASKTKNLPPVLSLPNHPWTTFPLSTVICNKLLFCGQEVLQRLKSQKVN